MRAARTDEELGGPAEVFGRGEVPDLATYLPFLADESPQVRFYAARAFQEKVEPTVRHADRLITLLGDSDEYVRYSAHRALRAAGREVVPALLAARRRGGRHRSATLELLIDLVGFDSLESVERSAISRLMDIGGLGEQPEPIHLCGGWFAVPTSDRAAVLEALELSDAMPVTMRLGELAWNHDRHAWSRIPHQRCRRAYVPPVLDGWTLVFGDEPESAHRSEGPSNGDEFAFRIPLQAKCRELSERFGEAHWYGTSCGDGWTSWCIARAGTIVRYFDRFEPEIALGEPLAAEADEYVDAAQVAAALSVNPEELGADTHVDGRALLVLTKCGRENGMPVGLLEDPPL